MPNYVYKIITDLSKFQERIDEVESNNSYDEVKETVAMLKDTLKVHKDLVCLCAPQLGVKLRLFCVKSSDGRVKTFLNPLIIKSEGMHLSRETNPSFPEKEYIIPRKDKVHLAYQHTDGRVDSETYIGVYAEVIQQMIEMLDGITLADYGFDLDDVGGPKAFDKATKKDKETVIQMYLDNLKLDSQNINKQVEATPALKQINDTINFMTGMLTGDIKAVDDQGNIVEKTEKETK